MWSMIGDIVFNSALIAIGAVVGGAWMGLHWRKIYDKREVEHIREVLQQTELFASHRKGEEEKEEKFRQTFFRSVSQETVDGIMSFLAIRFQGACTAEVSLRGAQQWPVTADDSLLEARALGALQRTASELSMFKSDFWDMHAWFKAVEHDMRPRFADYLPTPSEEPSDPTQSDPTYRARPDHMMS